MLFTQRRFAWLVAFASCLLASLALVNSALAESSMMRKELKLEPIVIGTPERIEVFPSSIKLESPRRRMHLIVTGHYAGGQTQDLTRAAKLTSSNAKIIRLEGGIAVPVADGKAEVIVTVGKHSTKATVEVSGQGQSDPVSFQFETLTALTKNGCNGGACHGSPSGKGGFRLSLFAYDEELDKTTLIREEFGRRVNVLSPEASLLLQKPMMKIGHGGGLKLRKTDAAYQALHGWIAEGAQLDPADAPTCTKVEVYPPSGRVLKRPAHTQQVLVLAHFSDGSIRDVTPLASYSSSDEAVASVREDGLVVAHDRGQAAIMVRYLEKVETCYMTFVKDIPGYAWNNPPAKNYIDELVYKKLQQLKYVPSELCTDEEFIRRAYLDVIGLLPTAEETKSFLDDPSKEKRSQWIDKLLDRPEYARFWALKWGDLLRINKEKVTDKGVHKYYSWLVQSFANNMPYDQFVRELITSHGSTFTNPPANFYRTAADTNDCTETSAQLFLGVRIQCAKCHNHPFERWTQDNYYGLGAFFNRIQRKKSVRQDELVVWVSRAGEVTQPRTGKQMKPWLPLIGDAPVTAEGDRRHALADWLTKADNPFFARVEANRIWAHVVGKGIVDPIDDFRDSNPPSNAPLLDALGKDFAEHGFDRKQILRRILNSYTYQRSATTNDLNRDDTKYFSHAQIRLLSAEQLLDAICHVTGVPEKFPGLPAGTRATQMPSPNGKHDFLKVFGQPERQTACACERSTDSNLSQALQLFSGPLIHAKLKAPTNRFRKLMAAKKSDEEIIKDLYLAGVSRQPTERELAVAMKHLEGKEDKIPVFEDICWALINTNEFLFQH